MEMRGLEALEGYSDSVLSRQMQELEEELNEKGAKDLELEADQVEGRAFTAPSIGRKSPRKTKQCLYRRARYSFE